MSKDFDTALADALDHTAHAVRTSGPEAARTRGRKRTMRKRIALSTTALVLVAIGATAAFAATSSTGGAPQMTPAGPARSTSGSSTAGPAQAVNSSPSATASPSSATSSSAASGSTGSESAISSQTTTAGPHQVVQAAWLSAGQLPFADTVHWNVTTESLTGNMQLTSTVGYLPNTTTMQALTTCADPTKLLGRTAGTQFMNFSATTATGTDEASQFIFFFADAASAQQTYTWLQSQYSSSCLLNGSGAQVTKTGSEGTTGATWLTLKGTSGYPDLPLYERDYFVLRGNTIAYVYVTCYPETMSTTYDDATQLSTIAAHLCVYGGPCS